MRFWTDCAAWRQFLEFRHSGAGVDDAEFVRHFSKKVLALFVLLTALLTLNLTLNVDVFHVLGDRTAEVYTVIGGILVAWASLKLFDEPVRLWLKNHWLKK